MNYYLAIILFCAGSKCGLLANTQEAHLGLAACQAELEIMVEKMSEANIDFMYPACVPLKFMRSV